MSDYGIPSEQRARLSRLPELGGVAYFKTLASTNDLAIERACKEDCPLPLLIVAEQQSAGRGRGSHRWESGPGGLTFSLVVHIDPPHHCSASIAAGIALCEAVASFIPDENQLRLKWPNDLYLEGKKMGGILVEAPAQSAPRRIIGVGLNVNNSMQHAPAPLADKAIALEDWLNREIPLGDLLMEIIPRLIARLAEWAQDPAELVALWQKRSLLTGRRIQVRQGEHIFVGLCQGIDAKGALLVDTDVGLKRCVSGTVEAID